MKTAIVIFSIMISACAKSNSSASTSNGPLDCFMTGSGPFGASCTQGNIGDESVQLNLDLMYSVDTTISMVTVTGIEDSEGIWCITASITNTNTQVSASEQFCGNSVNTQTNILENL